MITTADLKHALSRLGYSSVDEDTIGHILQEVDFDRKGSINFEDFIEIAAGLKGASSARLLLLCWRSSSPFLCLFWMQSSRCTRPSRTSPCRTTPRRITSPPRSRRSVPEAVSKGLALSPFPSYSEDNPPSMSGRSGRRALPTSLSSGLSAPTHRLSHPHRRPAEMCRTVGASSQFCCLMSRGRRNRYICMTRCIQISSRKGRGPVAGERAE